MVFDEIPSGVGKTGRFFAFEHFDVRPDMVVLGKALGGGILPIAAVVADGRFDVAPELSLGHYTHEKNPLTTRAALTTVTIILRDRLHDRAARLEKFVRNRVAELALDTPALRGVRGKGLLLAVELDLRRLAATSEQELLSALWERGISTTTKSDDAIGFSPPLTISELEIETALKGIANALNGMGHTLPTS